MSQAKDTYIEWLESQMSDADWHPEGSRYERHLDEQYGAWGQQEEEFIAFANVEADDLEDWMDEVEWQRRGC